MFSSFAIYIYTGKQAKGKGAISTALIPVKSVCNGKILTTGPPGKFQETLILTVLMKEGKDAGWSLKIGPPL